MTDALTRTPAGPAGPAPAASLRSVPLRRPGLRIAALALLFLLVFLLEGWITNPRMRWGTVGEFLFSPVIMEGLRTTLLLTALAMTIGIVGGVLLAVLRMSANPILANLSWCYIWVFRGTPLLVQLLFWYFLSAIVPKVGLGIPWGPTFIEADTNTLITQMAAAVLGLGLHEAAYMAEIVRAGISSVDDGQNEAAAALGMSRAQTLRRIVLPQALRIIIPPTGNQAISMLKTTSLVFAIAVPELLTSIQGIYSRNFQQVPLLVVACFWYLVATSVLNVGQYYLERRYGRGAGRALPPTPLQRLRAGLGAARANDRTEATR
ncbi:MULTISPECIES: amino acid ABC transporter permease [unclassified Streptomyces]|uniref:amino acid ABC transporter permease n=1 Tax=unclassified Streptomyces TaxID=2593676 RepID=UPI002DDB1D3D|nr:MULTISPECIES: amino acid ABC transporter permease [unclassified Streptomyces]WSA93039.1 amino acid ABC transporter permease [Streptomyces sp. NBC_01795]WSB77409.1 amino acid ABC transporter permease [Streptomyces sp. NBC_01775]WSS43144.1 amino acid ABC transporter permease [Streptomyces sp. NBC_01187]